MNRFGLGFLSIAILAPLAHGAEDWQDNLAKVTRDMPSVSQMRDDGIIDSYVDQITSNFVGETDEDKSGNVFQFAFNRLRWLSACSLLYNKQAERDDSWMVRHKMVLMQRHVSLFATATVATIDPTLTTDELVAMMMQKAAQTEGPRFDQWLSTAEGRNNSDYKHVKDTCSKNLREITSLEQ